MKYKIVGLGILVLLCWMGCCPLTCRSAVGWADYFDDGTYEPEWTIVENDDILDSYWGFWESNWSASEQYLQMLESQGIWGVISRSSDVAAGTWSFDIKLNLTGITIESTVGLAMITFMGNNLHDLESWNQVVSYSFQFMPSGSPPDYNITIRLRKIVGGDATELASYMIPEPVVDWNQINVTRTMAGLISVYYNHNTTPIIQATDTSIVTSETLWLRFQEGQMLDNIVVIPELGDGNQIILILIGAGVAVIVIVIAVILIRRRRS